MRERLKNALLCNVPDIAGKKIYVWGTGNTASLYQQGFIRLEEEGIHINGYVDNNSDKWGKLFGNKKIVAPLELKNQGDIFVLICSPQPGVIQSINKDLEKLNVEFCLADELILKSHADEVLKCYDMLADDKSKEVYATIIMNRLSGKYPNQDIISKNQYFEITDIAGDIEIKRFVDCGAYVGDSIERYIWNADGVFDKIIGFEPDKKNFKAMQTRVKRLSEEWNIREDDIILYPYGIGEKSTSGVFESYDDNNGLGSKFVAANDADGALCTIVSLDEQLQEPYSFLKADIESYEYQMLLGAKEGIKEYKPALAICVYHNAVDMYAIPLLIKSMVPEYKMAVRHYSSTLSETVLYCWIEK